MLGITIQNVFDMLKSSPGKRAHVKPESQKVGVEKRCHERVSEKYSAKEDACKDGNFGIGNKSHSRIVIGLDPGLDEFGNLGRRRSRSCWCRRRWVGRCG